jgi:putative copper resistance protein D
MAHRLRSTLLAAPFALAACGEATTTEVTPATTAPAAARAPAASPPPATQASPPAGAPPASAAILAIGERVYKDQCLACHGTAGRGDGAMARSLPVKPRSFAGDEWRHADLSKGAADVQAAITRVVREGIPDAMMPGYASSLSEEQIAGVVRYVLELRRREREG